jgi:phosphohistidine phosphatase
MNLYILRHGLAAERDPQSFPDDSRRPLLEKGEERTRLCGDALRALEVSFDRILSSPYLRASQTAEIVAATLGLKKRLEFREELAPGGDAKALLRYVNGLRPAPENVLLVGHEPDLSELISRLISGGPAAAIAMKKGGLAKLAIEAELRYARCATLSWLLTPKQMALLA